MSITKTITDFAGVVTELRAQRDAVDREIHEAVAEQDRLKKAPPHTEDIIAVFKRSLGDTKRTFESQFQSYLLREFGGDRGVLNASPQATGKHMLTFPARELSHNEKIDQRGKPLPAELNSASLAYLLADKIADALPALVERLLPSARDGIKGADRVQALSEVGAKIEALKAKRAEINDNLEAAYKAIQPSANFTERS